MSLLEHLNTIEIPVDNELLVRLESYTNILLEWNKTHNLTGAKNHHEVYENIIDSIYPLRFLPKIDTCIDIGSGAGFPALVLACTLMECSFHLVEPRKKRASFLRYAAINIGLDNIKVHATRIENLNITPPNLLTSRAVSDTATLLKLASHLIAPHTTILLYKGENEVQESKKLGLEAIKRHQRYYLYKQGES